jgi:hypothetical protein
MRIVDALAARIYRATTLVDRAYRLFDRTRSASIARFSTDGALRVYNDLAFGTTERYTAGTDIFRNRLFRWEEQVTARVFPKAPARLLIGGAGGGREAFAWAEAGYDVVAFEPARSLVASLVAHTDGRRITSLVGGYLDLPRLRPLDGDVVVDLSSAAPFDVAVFGWTSYSHMRGRDTRVRSLRQMAALTMGPVVVSMFVHQRRSERAGDGWSRLGRRLGFRETGDAFSPAVGFYHWSTREEVEAEIAEAGLEIIDASYDDRDGEWPWIAARRLSR